MPSVASPRSRKFTPGQNRDPRSDSNDEVMKPSCCSVVKIPSPIALAGSLMPFDESDSLTVPVE